MKKGVVKFSFFSLLVLLILVNKLVVAEYNISDPKTWYKNLGDFQRDLSDPSKLKQINEILNKLAPDQRRFVFKNIIAALNIPQLERRYSSIEVIGFESKNLVFSGYNENGGKLWVHGGGYLWIDLKNLPKGTKYVKYIEEGNSGKFVIGFQDNREIEFGRGWLEKEETKSDKGWLEKIKIFDDNKEIGEVVFDDKIAGGKFSYGKDKDISLISLIGSAGFKDKDGNVFFVKEQTEQKKGYINVLGDREYATSNLIIKNKDESIVVRTPAKNLKDLNEWTKIILKEGDYSNLAQYVQIYDNNLKIIGKDIELDILKNYKKDGKITPYGVFAKGENILLKIGDNEFRVDKDGIHMQRVGFKMNDIAFNLVNGDDKRYVVSGDERGIPVGDNPQGSESPKTPSAEIPSKQQSGESETKPQVYVVVGEEIKSKNTVIGPKEIVKTTTALGEGYKNLPDDLLGDNRKFEEEILNLPKKIEVKIVFGGVPFFHPGPITGKEIYDSFFSEKEGQVFKWKEEGLFPNDEYEAFKGLFGEALGITNDNPDGVNLPKNSKIFIDIGSKGSSAEIRVVPSDGNEKRIILRDPSDLRLKAIRTYTKLTLTQPDPEMPGYNPREGIKTRLDRLKQEFPRRGSCEEYKCEY